MIQSAEFLTTAKTISLKASKLYAKFFSELGQAEVDYISVFPDSPDSFNAYCAAAEQLGSKEWEKNGPVYLMKDQRASELPSQVVRVREPHATPLIGCVDFVVPDFARASELASEQVACQESAKSNGDLQYRIIEVTEPDTPVAMYLPSLRMTQTEAVMRRVQR
jgi:hypothetical protein